MLPSRISGTKFWSKKFANRSLQLSIFQSTCPILARSPERSKLRKIKILHLSCMSPLLPSAATLIAQSRNGSPLSPSTIQAIAETSIRNSMSKFLTETILHGKTLDSAPPHPPAAPVVGSFGLTPTPTPRRRYRLPSTLIEKTLRVISRSNFVISAHFPYSMVHAILEVPSTRFPSWMQQASPTRRSNQTS